MFALQSLNFPMNIRSPEDILPTLSNDRLLSDAVENISRNYLPISIAESMSNLAKAQSFLGSPEDRCIYQTQLKNFWVVSTSFVKSSLLAHQYHKLALLFFKEKNDPGKALEMVVKTGIAAEKMARYTLQLISQFEFIFTPTTQLLPLTLFKSQILWLCVRQMCLRLANTDQVREAISFEEKFEDTIKESGLCWLALARINLIASRLIEAINNKSDEIKCTLQDEGEVADLLLSLIPSMLDYSDQENKL